MFSETCVHYVYILLKIFTPGTGPRKKHEQNIKYRPKNSLHYGKLDIHIMT